MRSKSSAERKRRYRERKREGQFVIPQMAVDEFALFEFLKGAGFLGEWNEGSRAEVIEAIQRLWNSLLAMGGTRLGDLIADGVLIAAEDDEGDY